MKALLVIIISILITSCASDIKYTIKEKMLPNGNWQLDLFTYMSCQELIDDENKDKNASSNNFEIPLFKKSLSEIINQSPSTNDPKYVEKCRTLFNKTIEPRSKSLCPDGLYELYGCLTTRDEYLNYSDQLNMHLVYGCYLRCK